MLRQGVASTSAFRVCSEHFILGLIPRLGALPLRNCVNAMEIYLHAFMSVRAFDTPETKAGTLQRCLDTGPSSPFSVSADNGLLFEKFELLLISRRPYDIFSCAAKDVFQ